MRLFGCVAALAFAALCNALPQQATACSGPSSEDHHFPSCTISLPDSTETVSVIKGQVPFPKASVHLGDAKLDTVVATITIAPSDARHYLVLESWYQVIWNIEGDTDSVSRVIVLGADTVGPWGAGIIGIPKEKIVFTDPDLSALNLVQNTSCTRISRSCTASQWFDLASMSQEYFHPVPGQQKMGPAHEVRPRPQGVNFSDWPVQYVFVRGDRDKIITIDPAKVVSLRPATPYP